MPTFPVTTSAENLRFLKALAMVNGTSKAQEVRRLIDEIRQKYEHSTTEECRRVRDIWKNIP